MIIEFNSTPASLGMYLPPFLRLAGDNRWKKRAVQLSHDAIVSPYHAKIVADYHWLELALSEQLVLYEAHGGLIPGHRNIESITALFFAQTVVEVHRHLSTLGRKVLEGRIRDGLKANTGLSSLYLEMSVARMLLDAGYDVEFSDMEGIAQFDLRFERAEAFGEVECKSLSSDAGRKVHRKDFYRFVDSIDQQTHQRAMSGCMEALVITLDDRLPADVERQRDLRQAAERLLLDPALTKVEGVFFVITREDIELGLGGKLGPAEPEFYQHCRTRYGTNCHVAGNITPYGCCLVVVRSQREDDSSKPILDAMEKAVTQFSGTRPAFIAVQFGDIEPSDLLLSHFRRRLAILSNYLFHKGDASHILATRFTAYRGLVASDSGIGEPAVAALNPTPAFQVASADYSPFLGGNSSETYVRLLEEP